MFTFNLPFLGAGASLGIDFVKGAACLLLGLIFYNYRKIVKSPQLDKNLDSSLSTMGDAPAEDGFAAG